MGSALATTRPDHQAPSAARQVENLPTPRQEAATPEESAAGVPRYLGNGESVVPQERDAGEEHARNATAKSDAPPMPGGDPGADAGGKQLRETIPEPGPDTLGGGPGRAGHGATGGESASAGEEISATGPDHAQSPRAGGGGEGGEGGGEAGPGAGPEADAGGADAGGSGSGGGAESLAAEPAPTMTSAAAPGEASGAAALGLGDLVLLDTELAEHQRWGGARDHVGAAGSDQRAAFILETAGGGALAGAASGFGTALTVGLLTRASKSVPVIGPLIGGAMALHGLISGWGATKESVSKFGEGSDAYETLANSIEAISAVIAVATGIIDIIGSIATIVEIAATSLIVGGVVASIFTAGAAASVIPIAMQVRSVSSTIARVTTIASGVLNKINSLVLQPAVTLFRALHSFTSQADPRDVEAQGAQLSAAAAASGGALGGWAGGKAAHLGAGATHAPREEELPARKPPEENAPPASGEGPVVHFDEPPAARQAPGAPAPVEVPAPVDPHAPTVPAPAPVDPHAPTVPAPAPVDPHAPTVPAPAPVDPHAPTVPAPAPVDPHAPTVPAPEPVDPHAPTAIPEGPGGMPEIPKPAKVPQFDDPGYGPEPDHRAPPSSEPPGARQAPVSPETEGIPRAAREPPPPGVPEPEPTQRSPELPPAPEPQPVTPPAPAVPEPEPAPPRPRQPPPPGVPEAPPTERTPGVQPPPPPEPVPPIPDTKRSPGVAPPPVNEPAVGAVPEPVPPASPTQRSPELPPAPEPQPASAPVPVVPEPEPAPAAPRQPPPPGVDDVPITERTPGVQPPPPPEPVPPAPKTLPARDVEPPPAALPAPAKASPSSAPRPAPEAEPIKGEPPGVPEIPLTPRLPGVQPPPEPVPPAPSSPRVTPPEIEPVPDSAVPPGRPAIPPPPNPSAPEPEIPPYPSVPFIEPTPPDWGQEGVDSPPRPIKPVPVITPDGRPYEPGREPLPAPHPVVPEPQPASPPPRESPPPGVPEAPPTDRNPGIAPRPANESPAAPIGASTDSEGPIERPPAQGQATPKADMPARAPRRISDEQAPAGAPASLPAEPEPARQFGPVDERSFADLQPVVDEVGNAAFGDHLASETRKPIQDIPRDTTQSRQAVHDAAYDDIKNHRPADYGDWGVQDQHWYKNKDATIKAVSGTDPATVDAINANRSGLQTYKTGEGTLLLNTQGVPSSELPAGNRGTRFYVDETPLGRPAQSNASAVIPAEPGAVGGVKRDADYNSEHRFADRHLIPEMRRQIQDSRAQAGLPPLDDVQLTFAAGEQARYVMEGVPATDLAQHPTQPWSGEVITRPRETIQLDLLPQDPKARADWQRTMRQPGASTGEPAAGQPAPPTAASPLESGQAEFNFNRPTANSGTTAETPSAAPDGGARRVAEGDPGKPLPTRGDQPLTDAEFALRRAQLIARGVPPDQIHRGDYTAFHPNGEGGGHISIGPDVNPLPEAERPRGLANPANAALDAESALSHEAIGHREAELAGQVRDADWHEELQASVRAALLGPRLSPEQRQLLLRDAAARRRHAPNDDTLYVWTGRPGERDEPGPRTTRPGNQFRPQDQLPAVIIDPPAVVADTRQSTPQRESGVLERSPPLPPLAPAPNPATPRTAGNPAPGGDVAATALGTPSVPGAAVPPGTVAPSAPTWGTRVAQAAEMFRPHLFGIGDPAAAKPEEQEAAQRAQFTPDNQPAKGVERVNPEYPEPPGTKQQVAAMQEEISQLLATKARSEQEATQQTRRAEQCDANQGPLQQTREEATQGISAVRAQQESVARHAAANQAQQQRQQESQGLVAGYPSQAAGLAVLTVPLTAWRGFTSLASYLPGGAGAKMLQMNHDASQMMDSFEHMGEKMAGAGSEQPAHQAELQGDAGRLENAGSQAETANGDLHSAQAGAEGLLRANSEAKGEAEQLRDAATRRGAQMGEAATGKQEAAKTLAERMQAWAVAHKAARQQAIAATQARLQAQGKVNVRSTDHA